MAYIVEKSQKVGGEESTDQVELIPIRWLVEQGLTSHWTQFRSFQRRCFYRSDDPTNSVKALKEEANQRSNFQNTQRPL